MIRYLREYRFYILLFLFLLIPISAIDTTTRAPRDYRFYDKAILAVVAPIQMVIRTVLDGSVSFAQNYLYLFNTRIENQALLEENRRLLNSIASLQETLKENERLKRLLGFQEQFKLKTVVARVIAKDVSNDFRMIRINRGEEFGIKPNMAVVSDEGIVGRVLRVSNGTADVVTILDLLSAVDSIVERSRARGVVEGLTDEVAQLKFALRTDDIQPGDLLITSGLEGTFPKGVPVGTVSKVNRKSFGITQEVEVRPSVDFSKLEEVLIVTSFTIEPTLPTKSDPKVERDSKSPAFTAPKPNAPIGMAPPPVAVPSPLPSVLPSPVSTP